ncbi:MAG: winged helix DNA-binding protein [Candidatus Heimdallarchaeota archaeon]
MSSSTNFEKVKAKLPPSAQKIYLLLAVEENGLTTKEIVRRVTFTSRTVRYALKKLLAMGLVQKLPYLLDMRQFKHRITKVETRQ